MLTLDKLNHIALSPHNKDKVIWCVYKVFNCVATVTGIVESTGLNRPQVMEIIKRSPYLVRDRRGEKVRLDRTLRDGKEITKYVKSSLNDCKNASELLATHMHRTRKKPTYDAYIELCTIYGNEFLLGNKNIFFKIRLRMVEMLETNKIIIS